MEISFGALPLFPNPYLARVRLSRPWTQAWGQMLSGIELLEGSDGA